MPLINMAENKTQKPFSKQYVMDVTKRNMLRAIDISFKMTSERMQEFEGNHDKSNELFVTLGELQALKKSVKTLIGE